MKQGLAGAHAIQIVVRLNLKYFQNLVQQKPVLGGDADFNRELRMLPAEVQNHRAQFDRLGAGTEYDQDLGNTLAGHRADP
jgi:hypothetical protein